MKRLRGEGLKGNYGELNTSATRVQNPSATWGNIKCNKWPCLEETCEAVEATRELITSHINRTSCCTQEEYKTHSLSLCLELMPTPSISFSSPPPSLPLGQNHLSLPPYPHAHPATSLGNKPQRCQRETSSSKCPAGCLLPSVEIHWS